MASFVNCRLYKYLTPDLWAFRVHELKAGNFAEEIHTAHIGSIARRISDVVAKRWIQNQRCIDDWTFHIHKVVEVLQNAKTDVWWYKLVETLKEKQKSPFP